MPKLLLLALIFTNFIQAESRIKKVYKWSVAALVAGNSLDAASSWGKVELNPILRSGPQGTFGVRGVGVKSGVLFGALAGQLWLIKRYPTAQDKLAGLNFGLGVVTTGVAVRNWRQK